MIKAVAVCFKSVFIVKSIELLVYLELNPARIHANWTSANETQDFCHDNTSCYDRMAICRDDSVHAEKFCQCPSTHTANYERGTCGTLIAKSFLQISELFSLFH